MSDSELLNEVRRWLRFAREDLEVAEALSSEARFLPDTSAGWLSKQLRRLSKERSAHNRYRFRSGTTWTRSGTSCQRTGR